MVTMDWKTILSFNHEDITDEDKEKIHESISLIDTGDIEISFSDIKGLFIIAQEILQFKGEQVLSLTSELDEIAKKQGEMEAELQLASISRKAPPQLKDLTQQIEERDTVLQENKILIEKLNSKIETLEDQVDSLRKQKSVDEEEEHSWSSPDPIAHLDRYKELGDALKKKNGQIKELLSDIQVVNEENSVLRNKLNHLKEKLSEATFDIKNLSLLVTNTKAENKQLNDKIEEHQRINISLKEQMKELMYINKDQDSQLDEFTQQMDSRINDWKDILNERQTLILSLQDQISQMQEKASVVTERDPEIFTKVIKQREEQIDHLQNKLREATQDILRSTAMIEQTRKEKDQLADVVDRLKMGMSQESVEGTNLMEGLRIEVEKWKMECTDLEECLKIKEAEVVKLVNQYENVEDDDARKSTRKIQKQLKVRDDHIHKLVAENNKYSHILDQVQLENAVMRKKLNLPPEEPISTEDILSKHQQRKKELNSALKKISQLEEQKISLQIYLRQKEKCIRKLSKYIKGLGVKIPDHFLAAILTEESASQQAFETEVHEEKWDDSTNNRATEEVEKTSSLIGQTRINDEEFNLMKENYQHVIDENEGLRKGLHEILDAIKEKALTSPCEITSVCLERLLQALDARHAAGWYHPAMRMLMELQTQKGHQDSLRNMLKEARQEILSTLDLLAKESQKSIQLQKKLTEIELKKDASTETICDTDQPPEKRIKEDTGWIFQQLPTNADFTDFMSITETYIKPADESYSKTLQSILKHFHRQFETLYGSMIEIFNQSTADKTKWQALEEQYKGEIENMSATLDSVNVRLDEMEKMNASKGADSDLSLAEVDMAKIHSIVGEKAYTERRCRYLEEALKYVRTNNQELKTEILNLKKDMYDKLKVYEVDCQKFMFHVAELRNGLRRSVPMDVFLKQNENMNNFEMKYRTLLNKEFEVSPAAVVNQTKDDNFDVLKEKLALLERDKEELLKAMKNDMRQTIESGDNNSTVLDSKMSECRTELLASNQRVKYLESVNRLLTDQLDNAHTKLDNSSILLNNANTRITSLESENIKLQEKEMDLISKVQQSVLYGEELLDMENAQKLTKENEILKLENIQLTRELEILNNQINDIQHDKLVNDLEMNILRHQILDLQSANDNKAIVARLSGEILVSHLHTAEMHKKRERLSSSLQKERERTRRLENLVHEKEMQFDAYVSRTNFKISFLSSALQCMREQYQCSVPMAILENILNSREENKRVQQELSKKEIEKYHDEQQRESSISESVELGQIEDGGLCAGDSMQCQHMMEAKLKESKWQREKYNLNSKLEQLEDNRSKLESKLSSLEESILMLTFAFGKDQQVDNNGDHNSLFHIGRTSSVVELMDIDGDDINQINDHLSKPIPKPRTFIRGSPSHEAIEKTSPVKESDLVNLPGSPIKTADKNLSQKTVTVIIQTDPEDKLILENALCQTDFGEFSVEDGTAKQVKDLQKNVEEALSMAAERAAKIITLENENCAHETNVASLQQRLIQKDAAIEVLNTKIEEMTKKESSDEKSDNESEVESLKRVLIKLKEMEDDKNKTIEEYKIQLRTEKTEHDKTSKLSQKQITDMKKNIEDLELECKRLKELISAPSLSDNYANTIEKYRARILELEENCFHLQTDMENAHTAMLSSRSECSRWQKLAADRLASLESLSERLESRHADEIRRCRAENEHWVAQLSAAREGAGDLRGELHRHRAAALREIQQREEKIDRLHFINANLKQQILNLQAVVSASDPTYELSAITELEEGEDDIIGGDNILTHSHRMTTDRQSESSVVDLDSNQCVFCEKNATYNGRQQTGWSESGVERLRREKQMLGKQNSLLRKQIRVLAARERRGRLELQNIKSQKSRPVYGRGKSPPSHFQDETFYLQKKIESLETELTERNIYNGSSSGGNIRALQIALWDKQKKWQEAAEKWKQRFQDKSSQLERLERNYKAAKATIIRLGKEKRHTDSRQSKSSRGSDGQTPSTANGDFDNHLELLLQDKERLEEEVKTLKRKLEGEGSVTQGSLMERLEAQQRKIISLELAHKGKDVLVSEYERLLEQNAFLAKRNLKLEAEILDSQLEGLGRRLEPDGSEGENMCCRRNRQQREHLESYVKLLKEENSQLISRNIEQPVLDPTYVKTGTVTQAKRMADLERTILTLRGLINGLQSENKKMTMEKEKLTKTLSQSNNKIVEELTEANINMKKMVQEKDELLEKAKELLKKAVEKERELVKEIATLKESH